MTIISIIKKSLKNSRSLPKELQTFERLEKLKELKYDSEIILLEFKTQAYNKSPQNYEKLGDTSKDIANIIKQALIILLLFIPKETTQAPDSIDPKEWLESLNIDKLGFSSDDKELLISLLESEQ